QWQSGVPRSPFRSRVRIDPERRIASYKVAYVSPSDSKRCPATRAVELLHELAGFEPGALTSVANEGDRTLSFHVELAQFAIGDLRARVGVHCASGPVYFAETRRRTLQDAAAVVFVPSLVAGRENDTLELAEWLATDLEHLGVRPSELPLLLQWLPGDTRPEVSPRALAKRLVLPFRGSFVTDRNTGEAIAAALFEGLRLARRAHLEALASTEGG
ncbi:MAG: hypothetical protein KC766_25250, partial [Myxococcales bacterium]|nr:hypothetical protein [Myxococcales bacterium]